MSDGWMELQREAAAARGLQSHPLVETDRIGIAVKTMSLKPLNGLRHPAHGNVCGWYLWGGELSADSDFFQVMHAGHLQEQFPSIVKYMALRPGYRFLQDGLYEDIWYDPKLLEI